MFGISFWEAMLILMIALIFIGPEKLPKVGRELGKFLRTCTGIKHDFEREWRQSVRALELQEQQKPTQPLSPTVPPQSPAAMPDGTDKNKF